MDRKSLRQFIFETTNYLQVWSVIKLITVTVTITIFYIVYVHGHEVYTGCMDMCHIYSILYIYARYINMCDIELIFWQMTCNSILNSHYTPAAVPIWCFCSMTTLVHQLAWLVSKGRPSSQCQCDTTPFAEPPFVSRCHRSPIQPFIPDTWPSLPWIPMDLLLRCILQHSEMKW